ncbi:MAG: amino acid permease, partial [Cyanobacteria bacterium P01_G01_bin.4]
LFGKPLEATDIELFGAGEGLSQPFWTVFAVFFPAVTGIMSGVNMSGDLKNPTRSIPVGTLAAVGVGYLIYMGLPVLLANRADASTLIADPLIMTKISMWGPSILLGVWGATLSSALGSILGAPRVLQALARDKVLPRWMLLLGTGTGKNDEPRIGTIVTLGIVLAAVMLGDLDVIAPVLSMFFLTTYLVLNLAAGIEGFLDSPSFRPTFQVHWSLSILGAIGCLAVMFLINPVATVAAALIVAAIYFWLQRRELTTSWGDSRRGMWMAMLRQGIYQLSKEEDTKNWQPHLLVFSGAPTKRWSLIEFANALVNERGIVTIASVLPSGSRDGAQQENMETTIRDYVENRGLEALVRVMTASNPFDGMRQMVEIYGIGPLRPNTIVLGSSNDSEHLEDYTDALVQLHQAKRNVVIFQENSQQGFGKRRHIDVWWSGAQGNGGLMLLLADLLRNDADWNQAQLHLKLIVQDESAIAAAGRNVKLLLNQLRIDAECQIIQAVGRPFHVILKETSQRADLIFLGLATPNGSNYAQYYHELQQHSTDLPSTVFVLASPSFTFTDVLTQS